MNETGSKRVIRELSPPPSAYTERVTLAYSGSAVELRCIYERNGLLFSGGLRFRLVHSFRFRSEVHCTAWHVQEAYDVLVEIEESDWVRELVGAESSVTVGRRQIRHFLIYIDSSGAYEVAAEDYEWLLEESVH